MLEQKWFEDFKVGDKFHIPSKTITAAHFLFFAGLSGDNHPIHYDDAYAKATVFGRCVAHAFMLTAMTAPGASTLSPHILESVIAILGESSSYLKPVFAGDTVTPQLEVVELIPKKGKGVLKLKATITNQNGDIVMEGHTLIMLKCRTTAH
jgi:acyl dehydratase